MSKMQKGLLWLFGAMFLVPEILFFTTPSLISSLNGKSFLAISSLIVNYKIFFSHPFYLLTIIVVEWIGILGLFILCIRTNKKIIAILPFIVLLWLSFIFMIVYVTGVSMGL